VTLSIRPGVMGGAAGQNPLVFACERDAWPIIETVRIRPAAPNECAVRAGEERNAFASATGWTLSSAAIQGGVLALQAQGRATTQIVFPSGTSASGVALRVDAPGGRTASLSLALGGLQWSGMELEQTGEPYRPTVLCVPDWALGTGHELTVQTGTAVTVDALTVTSAPECDTNVFDYGFERNTEGQRLQMRGSWEHAGGALTVEQEAARTGSKGLRVGGGINYLRALVRMPEAAGGAGPALTLWHRAGGPDPISGFVVAPFGITSDDVVSTQWAQTIWCVGPAWAGQLATLHVTAVANTNASGGGSPHFDVDEAGPSLSPRCP
jgi:hypothetical protein